MIIWSFTATQEYILINYITEARQTLGRDKDLDFDSSFNMF